MTEIRTPLLMGVVNVTPDSFSDGGAYLDPAHAVEHGLRLIEDGAAMLDIGGESTRPGAEPVDAATELARVSPVIKGLAAQTALPISIDTRKPEVARAAIGAGASIWNDVSGLTYSGNSLEVAASQECRVILMHSLGDPRTMQDNPAYADVVNDVLAYLAARIAACEEAGIARTRIIVDPGIGFGKTLTHNLALLANLGRFSSLGVPVMLGASRKRFIASLDREGPAEARLGGSIAAALAGAARGVSIVRVHDVAATRQALKVATAIDSADTRR